MAAPHSTPSASRSGPLPSSDLKKRTTLKPLLINGGPWSYSASALSYLQHSALHLGQCKVSRINATAIIILTYKLILLESTYGTYPWRRDGLFFAQNQLNFIIPFKFTINN